MTPHKLSEQLADELTEVVVEALRKAGFPPGDKLKEEIQERIWNSITLR